MTLVPSLTGAWLAHSVSIPILWSVWYHDNHVLQVPRILNPVVLVVDGLPDLCKDAQVRAYVESAFGSVEQCRQAQLLPHLLRMRLHVCVYACVCVTAQAVSLLLHSQKASGADTVGACRQNYSLLF
jgi:hypothetical protein